MTFGSLFAGIGGFDLGLERAGMTCRWQVELDPYCRRVLRKHWPDVPKFRDVQAFPDHRKPPQRVDLICGGFPCQDASLANAKGKGIDGSRTGLWREFGRIIGELRPRYVLMENVPGLLGRGFGRVLGDLAEIGYDAEWECISAEAIGAPHKRERLWIVAYPDAASRRLGTDRGASGQAGHAHELGEADVAYPHDERQPQSGRVWGQERGRPGDGGQAVADSGGLGRRTERARWQEGNQPENCGEGLADPIVFTPGPSWREQFAEFRDRARDLHQWGSQPPVCGVADGVPDRTHRLRVLGNAVVPDIVEWIGRCIMAHAGEKI